jgi:anti-anti-sigma factor
LQNERAVEIRLPEVGVAAEVMRFDVAGPVFEFVGRSSPEGLTWAWARQDLDLATVPAAQAELTDLLSHAANPGGVLVCLGTGRFVDIRGLRLLLDVAGLVRSRGGRLVVVAPPICLRRMVAILGLEARLPLATTAQQAVSRMHVRPADAVIESIGRAGDGRW